MWLGMCVSLTSHLKVHNCRKCIFHFHLETHESQNFPMVTPRGLAKLSISAEVTVFPTPLPYPHPFISDQCLKGDR